MWCKPWVSSLKCTDPEETVHILWWTWKQAHFVRLLLWLFSQRPWSVPCTRVDLYACELCRAEWSVVYFHARMHSYSGILADFCSCVWRMDGALKAWCVQSCVRQRSSPYVSMLLPPSLALYPPPFLSSLLFSSGIPHPPSLYVLPYSLKINRRRKASHSRRIDWPSAAQKIAYNRDHRLDQGDPSKPSRSGKSRLM